MKFIKCHTLNIQDIKGNNIINETILLEWDENIYSEIHFPISKVTTSQGAALTTNTTITAFSHSEMEVRLK